MKLNELIGIKNLPKPSNNMVVDKTTLEVNQEIDNFLKSSGFRYLSSGRYGSTYTNGKYVLKVFSHDASYEAWLSFIKTIPAKYQDFVPRIKVSKNYPPEPQIKFVVMELLKPMDSGQTRIFQSNMELVYLYYYLLEQKPKDSSISKSQLQDLISRSAFGYYNRFIVDFDPDLFDFLLWLKTQTAELKLKSDLHDKNIMIRGNQFVVTDPWA